MTCAFLQGIAQRFKKKSAGIDVPLVLPHDEQAEPVSVFPAQEENIERAPAPVPEIVFTDDWDDFPDHLPPPIDTR